MKFVSFFILFFCSYTLYAQSTYVIVTKVQKKEQLGEIYSRFSKLNLKMLYSYNKNYYTIYSGPYKTASSAKRALRRLHPYFKHAKISRRHSIGKKQESDKKVALSQKNSGFYLGLAMGYASAPSSHIIEEGSVLINEPNNAGMTLGASAGYNFESGFALGLGYMNFDATDIEFDNLYTELNYRFEEHDSFVPYFGALVGYSSLTWNVSPIPSPQKVSNNNSDSFFWGTQAGILYKISDSVSLTSVYQCVFMGHTTNINTSTQTVRNVSALEHNTLHSLQLGINYNF